MTTEKEMDWNMSDATMMRLHENLQRCHASRFQDNYHAWIKALENMHVELQALCSDEDRVEDATEAIQEANDELTSSRMNTDMDSVRGHLNTATTKLLSAMDDEGLLVKQRETTTIAGEN